MDLPLTLEETQKGLKEKKFSAAEIVSLYLTRIKKFDKTINAFLTLTEEKAFDQARKADEIIRQDSREAFRKYPLLGAAVAYKDLFLTKGIRTTAASRILESYLPVYSATVVTRLEAGGALCLGKVNCDAWAHGSSGENSEFGATKNPWNRDFVSGGSSSGSAAALAANFSLIATGTDTCGSIRVPANYCYCVGLKPTYGAVSRYGVIAMASSLDSVGHLTRNVRDCKKVFEVTRGSDNKDATLKNGPYLVPKSKLKIGLAKEFFGPGLDREVEKNISQALKVFAKAGIEIVEISLPHTRDALSVYYIIQPAEVASNLGRYDGVRYGLPRDNFGAEAIRRIMLGTYVLSAGYYDAYYLKAMQVRSVILKEVSDTFAGVDAIIAPVAPTAAFKLKEKTSDPLKMYLTDIFAATANLAGIPALAIPYEFTTKGLPLGFQLMGPRFSENILFYLGELFEKETGYLPQVANLKC